MKVIRKAGATSNIFQIFIADSSSTTGAGLTALTSGSSGLTAYYHRDTDTTATVISLTTMTLGTFTSSGFLKIDDTNMPGWYQFCPPDAAMAAGAKSVAFHLKGATNMAPLPIEVDLDAQVDVTFWNGTVVASPATAGIPDVNAKNINNVATTSVTTINANLGQTQPVNFTGTGASALVKSDTVDWAGTAVSTPATAGVVDVNVKNINNVAAATPGASGGILISGSNSGTTTLGALTVTGATVHTGNVSMAAGLTITQSSSNSSAVSITGNGTGHGILSTSGSGATGDGVRAVAASTDGNGISGLGTGAKDGLNLKGGTTGHGVNGEGGATSGEGAQFKAVGNNSSGMYCEGIGNGHGFQGKGGTAGSGMYMEGGTAGDGIAAQGHGVGAGLTVAGGNSAGPGFLTQGGTGGAGTVFIGAANQAGMQVSGGTGSGDAVQFLAAATGNGFVVKGGATSGSGMLIQAQGGNSDGLHIDAFGSGAGISSNGGTSGDGADFNGGSTDGTSGIYLFSNATNGNGLYLNGTGTGLDLSGRVDDVVGNVGITQGGADKVFGASGAAMAELGVAAPSATPSPRNAMMLVYMTLRNKLTTTATVKSIFNDAGTAITTKALSDNGVTYTEGEMS